MTAHASAQPLRIVAFPFAGGSAYSYARLARELPAGAAMTTLEPPGHGRRMGEAPLRSIPDIAADLRPQVLAAARGEPYLLFGHSMGAYIALSMLDSLQAHGEPMPARMVLSGAAPPHHRTMPSTAGLSRADFLARVAAFGALPREVIEQGDLVELFEPILRADFEATEAFTDAHRRAGPLAVDVLAGSDDSIAGRSTQHWRDCFAEPPRVRDWPGGHFFIFDHARAVAAALAEPVTPRVDGAPSPH